MTTTDYTPLVSQILVLGDVRGKEKLDYLALGLGADHVPELCQVVLDKDLWWAESDSLEVWSAVHAWRALAQIGSPDAIGTLLEVMGRIDEDDDEWPMAELPDVFAAIGPAAIPDLTVFLADRQQDMWSRITCVACFEKMAQKHPETRPECVNIVTRQLKRFQEQDETFNGFLISALRDFKVVEAAPLIEKAFVADKVDWGVAGDWEEVQIELGLLQRRSSPRSRFFPTLPALGNLFTRQRQRSRKAERSETVAVQVQRTVQRRKSKTKKKRKQQKQSRRKQRK